MSQVCQSTRLLGPADWANFSSTLIERCKTTSQLTRYKYASYMSQAIPFVVCSRQACSVIRSRSRRQEVRLVNDPFQSYSDHFLASIQSQGSCGTMGRLPNLLGLTPEWIRCGESIQSQERRSPLAKIQPNLGLAYRCCTKILCTLANLENTFGPMVPGPS